MILTGRENMDMQHRLDFSTDGYVSFVEEFSEQTVHGKQMIRKKLAYDIAVYLENGGEIRKFDITDRTVVFDAVRKAHTKSQINERMDLEKLEAKDGN